MAEDLKARVANGQPSGVMRRPIRLTFDDSDDEIIVMSEREVEMEARNGQPARTVRPGESSFG